MVSKAVSVIGCLFLAACSGGNAGGHKAGTGAVSTVASAGDGNDNGGWARDACASFPVTRAAAASGLPIATAELNHPNVANGTTLSSCSYKTQDEKEHFTVEFRANTDGSQTMANHIAELSAGDGMLGPAEPLAVSKGQARFLPKLHQVVYFPDDARVVYVVGPGVRIMSDSDPDAILKERSLKIALAGAGQ